MMVALRQNVWQKYVNIIWKITESKKWNQNFQKNFKITPQLAKIFSTFINDNYVFMNALLFTAKVPIPFLTVPRSPCLICVKNKFFKVYIFSEPTQNNQRISDLIDSQLNIINFNVLIYNFTYMIKSITETKRI